MRPFNAGYCLTHVLDSNLQACGTGRGGHNNGLQTVDGKAQVLLDISKRADWFTNRFRLDELGHSDPLTRRAMRSTKDYG